VKDGILAHSPAAIVSVLTQPPVLGAALFALDALSATPRSHSTLQALLPSATRSMPPWARHCAAAFPQVSPASWCVAPLRPGLPL